MAIVIITFFFIDFFDTAGTLVAVANQAGLMKNNKLPRAGKALFADAIATVIGAILGTSTTTSYIESSAGVTSGWTFWIYSSCNSRILLAGTILLAIIKRCNTSCNSASINYCRDLDGFIFRQKLIGRNSRLRYQHSLQSFQCHLRIKYCDRDCNQVYLLSNYNGSKWSS